ncbi:hypothetical protein CY34DRAFT_799690 [Suillus luteus UH-Slu-Lm8-n1]|uniref:Unplaced genomic scaffold CY34scaffold_19, whole genome shotgun sequence n=1 Tax=Suillus luteus UH-Slu-Lm8-n1 TaxID=930992 RepID=A0A0D0BW23_9AGAM|nr:hypothetical protein CY34DRAFT_799690 [Suillus luteus UH-Slu-Lm8-n1]
MEQHLDRSRIWKSKHRVMTRYGRFHLLFSAVSTETPLYATVYARVRLVWDREMAGCKVHDRT